jgi:transposase
LVRVVPGACGNRALVLLSEIGTDMSRWSTEKHFASWLGLCPHHQISGGKVLSRKGRPRAKRAASALRLAAHGLHHSHSALGAFFRRLKARLGAPRPLPPLPINWPGWCIGCSNTGKTTWRKA